MAETVPDFYATLGVPRYTTKSGIRRAYLQKARRSHPDLNPDDLDAESRMSALNVAYGTLSNPARRARYDCERIQVRIKTPKVSYTETCAAPTGTRLRRPEDPRFFDIISDMIRRLVRLVSMMIPA